MWARTAQFCTEKIHVSMFARVSTGKMSTQAVVDATLRCMAAKVGDCGNVFYESFVEANINWLPGIAFLIYNIVFVICSTTTITLFGV